jgi:hypothetical protein
MSRLDDYRAALLAAHPEVPVDELLAALDEQGEAFPKFIIDHGLGPLWHERSGRAEFHESRMQAEALFVCQEKALREIDTALNVADIDHLVMKGSATRLLLYDNPAVRTCHDIDILVSPQDRVRAAKSLVAPGFRPVLEPRNISRGIVLARSDTDVDLHWGLLREGRLREDVTEDMLGRRGRHLDTWMQSPEDTLFTLLVHPAFADHLAGWGMGLHRVADVLVWVRTQAFHWEQVEQMLLDTGVRTAAWATLRWAQLLSGGYAPRLLDDMIDCLRPGRARSSWLEYWLENDLPARASGMPWMRHAGFLPYLHDTIRDVGRAMVGRLQAKGRVSEDLEALRRLFH